MYVLPLILSEDTVVKLPSWALDQLVMCSTDIIKDKIKSYIESKGENKEAYDLIRESYANVLGVEDYLYSEETIQKVNLIKDLQYQDITTYLSMERLIELKTAICDILNDERSKPYTPPVNGVVVKTLVKELLDYGKAKEDSTIIEFSRRLDRNARFFRDAQFASYRGTPVKRIVRNKDKYNIIIRGIDFLIEKKKIGAIPASWRYL